jgi:hypothetical protein
MKNYTESTRYLLVPCYICVVNLENITTGDKLQTPAIFYIN